MISARGELVEPLFAFTFCIFWLCSVYMQDRHRTGRYGADKIALLGFFALSLLIAQLITASRSALVFSEPIGLSYTGLSVSMPSGNGWKTAKQWEYRENAFALSSIFLPVSRRPAAAVQCRYLLAAPQTAADIQFRQKANALDGEIAETGSLQMDSNTVYWVQIKQQSTQRTVFFATVQLPNGRQFEIELHGAAGDTERARSVFMGIAESLKFEDVPLLAAGGRVVAQIKDKGLREFLRRSAEKSSDSAVTSRAEGSRQFFLIKDASEQTIGFTMDVFSFPKRASKASDDLPIASVDIQIGSLLYVRGAYPQEQVSIFKCENNLDEFFWKNEGRSLAGATAAEITAQQTGVMTVTQLAPKPYRRDYQLGPAAIPDFLFDLLLSQMLDDDCQEIIADLVDAEGKIIPTLISKIQIDDTADLKDRAQFAFKMEFLDGRDFSETVYLDGQHRIIKRVLRQQGLYFLERTDAQTVLKQFPERAEYILRQTAVSGTSL
jgi:hypothetical protein